MALVTRSLATTPLGPYQLQAAIAAVHAEAPSAEDTDWPEILGLYELLEHRSHNPMVTLNHAVAVAMVRDRRPGSTCWRLWTPTNGCPITIDSTRSKRTCRRWRAIWRPLAPLADSPHAARRASPSGVTSSPVRRA